MAKICFLGAGSTVFARSVLGDCIHVPCLLDPHTGAELTIDEIVAMCDDLIEAHGSYLPKYH